MRAAIGAGVKRRALDLFCSAGGATKGLQRAGFHVTGVDIRPQPRYVGDEFHQADALEFMDRMKYEDPGAHTYDFIWASPPCQAHTTLKAMWNSKEHADLIPQTRERLKGAGVPWCMENVPGSTLEDYFVLCGSMFGLGVDVAGRRYQLRRHRWFEASFGILAPRCHHASPTIGIYGEHVRDRRRKGESERGVDFDVLDRIELARAAMEMPWADWHGISQAIPPAYAEFIGRQVIEHSYSDGNVLNGMA